MTKPECDFNSLCEDGNRTNTAQTAEKLRHCHLRLTVAQRVICMNEETGKELVSYVAENYKDYSGQIIVAMTIMNFLDKAQFERGEVGYKCYEAALDLLFGYIEKYETCPLFDLKVLLTAFALSKNKPDPFDNRN